MSDSVRRLHTVTVSQGRFRVSEDPDNVLGYLLNTFLDAPFQGEAAQRFTPDGEGVAIPDTLLAVRAQSIDLADLPEEQIPADPDREWWLVSRERLHGRAAPTIVLIEGDDLRDLFRAAGLWSSAGH